MINKKLKKKKKGKRKDNENQVDDFVTCMEETPRFLDVVIAHDVNATIFFFFEREFQAMASAPDDSSLSTDQDISRFLV